MSVLLKLNFVFVVIFCLIESHAVQAQNYCNLGLCEGKPHIGCNNNGAFAKACAANAKVIEITPKLRRAILNKHNMLRNKIAKGNVKGYKQAIRMATMTWDKELAKLAVLNVKQCVMQHDACRKTPRFKKAGQNLASTEGTGLKANATALAKKYIQMWFDEYKYANMQVINNFQRGPNIEKYGHFTAMVHEKNFRVGCGMLRQTKKTKSSVFMACDYAISSVFGKPIYRSGPTASKCKTGKNKNFPGLCSTKEQYDVSTGSF